MDISKFAERDDDAKARAEAFFESDPFPSIAPTLLSSAEIRDYTRVTGMLYPFRDSDDTNVKSASYGAPIAGEHILWQPTGNTVEKHTLTQYSNCYLPANSISFVEIEPTFRLPMYMALRFNLAITHVHRGLLLGTGPLVDPGFWGRILIPIHNLTDSEYVIPAGDNLVWIEFTKTTYAQHGRRDFDKFPRLSKAAPFPPRKKLRPPDWYLYRAAHGNPIRSSIPSAVETSRIAAEQASASAAAIRDRVQFAGIVGAMALGAAMLGIYVQTHSLIQDAHNLSQSALGTVSGAINDSKTLSTSVQSLEQKLKAVEVEQQKGKETTERIAAELTSAYERLDALQLEMQLIRSQRPR